MHGREDAADEDSVWIEIEDDEEGSLSGLEALEGPEIREVLGELFKDWGIKGADVFSCGGGIDWAVNHSPQVLLVFNARERFPGSGTGKNMLLQTRYQLMERAFQEEIVFICPDKDPKRFEFEMWIPKTRYDQLLEAAG